MVPVDREVLNLVGFVELKYKNVVGVEAAAFAYNAHKVFGLSATNGYVRRNGIIVRSEFIDGVADVGETVNEQVPDNFTKLPERTLAIVAEGQKMHGSVGGGQANHAGSVEVVVGGEES